MKNENKNENQMKALTFKLTDTMRAFFVEWRKWLKETDGKRIRCRRHHLRVILSRYKGPEMGVMIALARVGDREVQVSYWEALSEGNRFMSGRSAEDVIFEYGIRFETLVRVGSDLAVYWYSEGREAA